MVTLCLPPLQKRGLGAACGSYSFAEVTLLNVPFSHSYHFMW